MHACSLLVHFEIYELEVAVPRYDSPTSSINLINKDLFGRYHLQKHWYRNLNKTISNQSIIYRFGLITIILNKTKHRKKPRRWLSCLIPEKRNEEIPKSKARRSPLQKSSLSICLLWTQLHFESGLFSITQKYQSFDLPRYPLCFSSSSRVS